MLKENIRNSYLTAFETVKAFVENEENIEKTYKSKKVTQNNGNLSEIEKER